MVVGCVFLIKMQSYDKNNFNIYTSVCKPDRVYTSVCFVVASLVIESHRFRGPSCSSESGSR